MSAKKNPTRPFRDSFSRPYRTVYVAKGGVRYGWSLWRIQSSAAQRHDAERKN